METIFYIFNVIVIIVNILFFVCSKKKAYDDTIFNVVENEIKKSGNGADLNHIDVSEVTNLSYFFGKFPNFHGDTSEWKLDKLRFFYDIFKGSHFKNNPPIWWIKRTYFKTEYDFNNSIEEWRWMDFENRIVYKNRYLKAVAERGIPIKNIPPTIHGFQMK